MRKRVEAIFLSMALIFGFWPGAIATKSVKAEETDSVKEVDLGSDHSGAVKTDGSLWMWGANYAGQIGDSTKNNSERPKKIMDSVKSISLGERHSGAVKTDGSLWMWGSDYDGEIGDGFQDGEGADVCLAPKKVLDSVRSVSLGNWHSGAVKTDGSLWMWGYNRDGELGNGTNARSHEPKKIMDGVQSVCLGSCVSAAIKTDGSLWMWGDNYAGQIGDGTTEDSNKPKKIMDGVRSVSLGGSVSAAIKTDGSLWMWGYNDGCGQFGDEIRGNICTPKEIIKNGVKDVYLGNGYRAVVMEDRTLWTCGINSNGELGDGTYQDSREQKKVMEEVLSISCGSVHTAAIKSDGSLWIWGHNAEGELGDGTTDNSNKPKQIILGKPYIDKKLNIQWGKDVFSFVNCQDDMGTQAGKKYDIDQKLILVSEFSWTDKMAMLKDLKNWGGSCFGMSTVTTQNYLGNLDLTKLQLLPYPKDLHDLSKPKSNSKVKSLIGVYQSSCITSKYMAEKKKFVKKGHNERIKDLYDKMCTIEETKTPVLVDYRWVKDAKKVENAPEGSNDGKVAHAVLAYALENEGAPYVYDGKSYDYRIRIIDPNVLYKADFSIEESNKRCIYINKECTDFCIPEGGERSDASTYRLYKCEGDEDTLGEATLQFVTNNKELLPPTNSNLSVTDAVSDTIHTSGAVKFSEANENLDTKIIGSVVTPGSLSGTDTESSGEVFVQPGEYTMDLTGSDQDVSYQSRDSYRNVSGQGIGTVKFLQGKGIEYQPVSGSYEISYAGNTAISKLNSKDITISGTGANKIKMTVETDGVKVTADHLKDLSVTTNTLSDGKEQETKISTDEKTVLIQNDTDGDVKILEDQDGDGKFEDPNQVVPKPPTVPVLKKISYVSKPSNAVYTGKYIKKSVKVKSGNITLRYGTDYMVSYSANKYCGKAKMIIRGRNRYTGTWTRYFYIYPKRVSMQKVYPGKGKAKVCYKKASGKISGYQIRYSRYKSFKKSKYKYTKKYRYTVKRLSRRKKYYFKVRAYKTIGKKRYYGSWSKYKRVRIK